MLHIIDTSNYAYYLTGEVVKLGNNQPAIEQYIKLNTMYLLSGAFFNNPDVSQAQYLFAGDSKPYWRYEGLKELGVIYKGKRGSGNSAYSQAIPLILTCLEAFLAKNDIYLCLKESYEADDIAALVASECADAHTNLVTSDHDWIPLVSVSNTSWTSTKQVDARYIADSKAAMKLFTTHKTYNESKAKKAFPKNDILDLWQFKARFGDDTDNIPADADNSGKFLPFIHLLKPPKEYDLKLSPKAIKEIKSYVTKPRKQITHQQFLNSVGRLPYDLALTKLVW